MKIQRNIRGFNMIELMVVVVIIGILAAIAVPVYSRYTKNARTSEATGQIGDLLTAAKSYAVEFEADGDPATAVWPKCGSPNFIAGNCDPTESFTYTITGGDGATDGTTMTIKATGIAGTKMAGVIVTLTIEKPTDNGQIKITGV